ncbi:hypothetical protein G7046_g5982 [Stylonectria norvegica]|nr:hypothetical protein G7046_g5982 [Stylonectria norvegica]
MGWMPWKAVLSEAMRSLKRRAVAWRGEEGAAVEEGERVVVAEEETTAATAEEAEGAALEGPAWGWGEGEERGSGDGGRGRAGGWPWEESWRFVGPGLEVGPAQTAPLWVRGAEV